MKKIILLLIVAALGAGSYFAYPYGKYAYQLSQTQMCSYDIQYDVDTTTDQPMLQLLSSGEIKGEYNNGKFHGYIYPESSDVALIEYYIDEENTIYVDGIQFAQYYLGTIIDTNSIIFKLISGFTSTTSFYLSDKQITEITGVEKGEVTNKQIGLSLIKSKLHVDDDTFTMKLNEKDFKGTLQCTIEEVNTIEIPDVVSDEVVQVIKTLYENANNVNA